MTRTIRYGRLGRFGRFAPLSALPVVALGVPLLVASCGTPEAGAAAVVGDRRISVNEVQRATADIQAYFGDGQEVAQQQVLFFLISGPYIVDAAAKAGVGVTPADARSQLDDKLSSPSEPGIAVFQANEAITRIGQLDQAKQDAALVAIKSALTGATVSLNPRYGQFDSANLRIQKAQQNWFASPSPSASLAPDTSAPAQPAPSAS